MRLRWVFTVKTAVILLKNMVQFMFNGSRSTFSMIEKVHLLTSFLKLFISVKTTKENALSNYSVIQRDEPKGH